MEETINFTPDFGAKENTSTIKVIGVGGGGSNAVQHMYAEGIQGVDYLVCNTDKCHLEACKIQDKLLLGNGLGAGANPDVAREFASKSEDKIKEFIGDNTKMLFIAAGMGKGTGTGASPVVAKVAKEMGILTVGVVTEPFKFEGKRIKAAAESGIEEMSKYVDSLIIVNNQNLMKYYNSLPINEAYGEVDDILKNAVKCVAEIITVTHGQNVDFNDVKSIMEHSGKALLGIATAQGEDRIQKVLDDVLNCPLLENADISDAKNFLFFVTKPTTCTSSGVTAWTRPSAITSSSPSWSPTSTPPTRNRTRSSLTIPVRPSPTWWMRPHKSMIPRRKSMNLSSSRTTRRPQLRNSPNSRRKRQPSSISRSSPSQTRWRRPLPVP